MNSTSRTLIRNGIAAFAILLTASSLALAVDIVPPMLGTINGPDYLVSVNRDTAFGTRIGHLGIGFDDAMTALEYDSVHNILYGATSASVPDLFTVNPSTGAATRVGAPGTLGFLTTGMAYNPIGDIMYAAGGSRLFRKNLYTINRATGTGTLLGPVAGISDSIQDLTFDPHSGRLYALDEFAPTGARIVTIDIPTLTATPFTGNIDASQNGWNSLAFDPSTGDLFAGSNTKLYRINPTTGNIVTVGLMFSPELHTYGALTVMTSYVPEPTSFFVCAEVAAVLFAIRRGRRTGKCRGASRSPR